YRKRRVIEREPAHLKPFAVKRQVVTDFVHGAFVGDHKHAVKRKQTAKAIQKAAVPEMRRGKRAAEQCDFHSLTVCFSVSRAVFCCNDRKPYCRRPQKPLRRRSPRRACRQSPWAARGKSLKAP